MKKLLAILLAAMMFALPALAMADELTMGSWRTDDVEQVSALLAKYEELTGVKIVFQPTTSTQYNATLRQQLDGGIGPDLFYSRTYSTGAELYENGFNVVCNDIPGVKENFTESALERLHRRGRQHLRRSLRGCQPLRVLQQGHLRREQHRSARHL